VQSKVVSQAILVSYIHYLEKRGLNEHSLLHKLPASSFDNLNLGFAGFGGSRGNVGKNG
jgi:hypothetical protein